MLRLGSQITENENILHFEMETFTFFGVFTRALKAAWAMLMAEGH